MTTFIISLIALVGGYFIYGTFVERVFKIDALRPTPAAERPDGVDYVPMATWRVYLVQFLNIAGVGPIFGAIMGVMYGPAAFLWIVLGTIFAGGVHDFISAMVSLRSGGKSLPELVGTELGVSVKRVMGILTCVLLLMVVAVFVKTPAGLLAILTPDYLDATFWAVAIFLYYILATLLPVDKLIGNLYPVFGFALLFMAVGIMCYLIFSGISIPDGMADGLFNRHSMGDDAPVFPMMFVSIACGAISGFHATQSPMMARCLKNERHGRIVFYGAMISEGIVALIWAAAAIAFTGGYDGLSAYMADNGSDAGVLVHTICTSWLGAFGGILAVLGVVAAPVTTGDTAMRSLRLIIADAFGISQKGVGKRLLVTLPVVAVTFLLMQINFDVLWRYFAWTNQTLSVFTLWTCSVYLARHGRNFYITVLPAMFMTCVCTTYICFAPTGVAGDGIGLSWEISLACGLVVMALTAILFMRKYGLRPDRIVNTRL